MPIPQYEQFMTPALKLLKDAPRAAKEILPTICEQLHISQEEQQEMTGTHHYVHSKQSGQHEHVELPFSIAYIFTIEP